MWNSDVTHPKEEGKDNELRHFYTRHLQSIFDRVKAADVFLVVCGPILYGERIRGKNPKDTFLNEYSEINRTMCESNKVKYVNLRREFWKKLPKFWDFRRGYLTLDGELLNRRGSYLAKDLITDAIDEWLISILPPVPRRSINGRSRGNSVSARVRALFDQKPAAVDAQR